MSNKKTGTIEKIALELSSALVPLADRLHQRRVLDIFAEFGLTLPRGRVTTNFENTIQGIGLAVETLRALTEELIASVDAEDFESILSKGLEIIRQITLLKNSIESVTNEISSIGFKGGLSDQEFDQFIRQLPGRLTETLVIEHLQGYYPILFRIFEILGLITIESKNEGATDEFLPSYTEKKLHLDKLNSLLDNPETLFKDVYEWGNDGFKGNLLITRLYYLFNLLGIPIAWRRIEEDEGSRLALEWFLFSLTPTKTITPKGIEAVIKLDLGENFSLNIPLSEGWSLDVNISLPLNASTSLRLQPPANLSLIPFDGLPQGSLKIELVNTANDENEGRISILSISGGSGISAQSIGMGIETTLIWDTTTNKAKGEFAVGGRIGGGNVAITSDESDGFISSLLSNLDVNSDFDLGFGWKTGAGFFIKGSGSLDIQLPLHVNIGPIDLNALILSVGISEGSIPVEFSTNIKAELGPLQATIEQLGAYANITPVSGFEGNLGPIDMKFGFKPPSGVGLSIDAGAVKGGGYLFFDHDRGEYAGALELIFSEWIALKAVGLITTKLPDGSKGFSLLMIITVEFGSGIQLGFGFTLLGVGGLLGLNRTVKVEPLRDAVKTGAAENIMFPQDVVANAPQIISDLRKYFPNAKDIFLIGPMAKIGYGTPTLISLTLGVIIESPPVAITILGVLKAMLPDENAAVLKLQVNFFGRIEPSNQLLWFQADLFDSRILFITIEGGMGLLVNWGDNSNFVISVGGFHPRYNPPPLPFDVPTRLAIMLLNESYARIRIEGYFAVTSNTAQFGARAELYFGFSAFKVDGHLAFDVLFQFDPFYFIFEFSLGMAVKVFGFGLFTFSVTGLLEGPSRWHIKGTARWKITFLGPTIKVRIDTTWGEEKQTELPPIAILPLIEKEFIALTNWEAVIPANSSILVTLRKLGETGDKEDQLVLHPVGKLRIRQRKMPLNLVLDKLGNQRPDDVNKLDVTARIKDGEALAIKKVKDKFATGEFKDLDNTKKLSSPGFELYDSGIEITPEGEQLKTSMAVKRIIRPETIIIDNNFKRHVIPFFRAIFDNLNTVLFGHFLTGNVITKSPLSYHYKTQIQPTDPLIQIVPQQYSVAFVDTNKPVVLTATQFTSQASANDYMQDQAKQNPQAALQMHVIPNTEVNRAA